MFIKNCLRANKRVASRKTLRHVRVVWWGQLGFGGARFRETASHHCFSRPSFSLWGWLGARVRLVLPCAKNIIASLNLSPRASSPYHIRRGEEESVTPSGNHRIVAGVNTHPLPRQLPSFAHKTTYTIITKIYIYVCYCVNTLFGFAFDRNSFSCDVDSDIIGFIKNCK